MKENYEQLFLNFTKTYKSCEDYLPRHKLPIINLLSVSKLIEQNNILALKASLIHGATNNLFLQLSSSYSDKYNEPAQRIAVDQAVLQLTKHGECGVQSGGFIWSLMENNVPIVRRGAIDEDLHAFVIIPSQIKGQLATVFDPYFKFFCPIEQYCGNEQVLKYGRSVKKDPNWKPILLGQYAVTYHKESYTLFLPILKQQLTQLLEFKKLKVVTQWMDMLEYALSLNEYNYSKIEMTQNLRSLFAQRVLEEDFLHGDKLNRLFEQHLPFPKTTSQNNRLFLPAPHDQLVAKFKEIIQEVRRGANLLVLLEQKKYGSALRTACNDRLGFKFVECLLGYKDKIDLDINECPSTSNKAAIDYASKHEDKSMYDLLLQHGAIISTSHALK